MRFGGEKNAYGLYTYANKHTQIHIYAYICNIYLYTCKYEITMFCKSDSFNCEANKTHPDSNNVPK